ncbi:hypothetical protein HN51_001958 [Arachis hypogaea]|uniref:Pectinesterase inhibitor domain-containing protein n=2 Tax=Arachis TaxID=3817 RepID=A0A445EPA2_ARAHY|nr:pectinesterase inhibitor 3 [Arachis hypogaea]QHO50095.1 uncharacterized protein DS421_1g19660 [Arachis hypogaea]RYR77297.1 hypothetical protein Ahy_A01g001740 [Arachis hypogaea]
MQTHNRNYHFILLLILFVSSFSATAQDLLRSSCSHARYPALCIKTLSPYATGSATPMDLAQAAVRVSLARSRSLSTYVTTLQSQMQQQAPPSTDRAALKDCVLQIADSVDELTRTLSELKNMRVGTASFQWHLSNARTWTSTSLTNCYSCVSGFGGSDGKVGLDVKQRVNSVGMLTSNALYLITRIGGADNGVGGGN